MPGRPCKAFYGTKDGDNGARRRVYAAVSGGRADEFSSARRPRGIVSRPHFSTGSTEEVKFPVQFRTRPILTRQLRGSDSTESNVLIFRMSRLYTDLGAIAQ